MKGARIVRFTRRGHAAFANIVEIVEILRDIEREWSAQLGRKRFAEFKALLAAVWNSPLVR